MHENETAASNNHGHADAFAWC